MYKKIISIFSFLLFISMSFAQEIVDNYIASYQFIAMSEMERTGIPASIKLAQGLLESDWGRSELSEFGNNHFGIKCGGSWAGKTYYKVDDDYDSDGQLTESCFRVFDSDEASYIAHSEFLLSNRRYEFLFDYESTDYKSWAKGLRKAGYATDPSYPSKLIGIIKKYELHRFDTMGEEDIQILAQATQQESDNAEYSGDSDLAEMTDEDIFIAESTNKAESENDPLSDATASINNEIKDFTKNFKKFKKQWNKKNQEDFTSNDNNKKSAKKGFNFDNLMDEIKAIGDQVLNREETNEEKITSFPDLTKHNGVSMVLSERGETLADISLRTKVAVESLVKYNDYLFEYDETLGNGTTIYLEAKKSSYDGSRKAHQVVAGETIAEISQRYGVTESSIRKRNYLKSDEEIKHGELLYLKGIRKTRKPEVAQVTKKEDNYLFESDDR